MSADYKGQVKPQPKALLKVPISFMRFFLVGRSLYALENLLVLAFLVKFVKLIIVCFRDGQPVSAAGCSLLPPLLSALRLVQQG